MPRIRERKSSFDKANTSPGGLQDVTLENSYTSFDAARAPGGIHSPMQGRSVRELEEQMSALRKENFNLKLRIYFMEEGQHGSRGGKPPADSPAKQLIDSKIEIEILRKRVDEKTELLKDAARAISQHEEMQKKADMESQALIEQMQQYIQQLESSVKQKASKSSVNSLDTEKLKALEAEIQNLESALLEADLREAEAKRHQELLSTELAEKQETLVACEAKIEELAIKNAKLLEELDKHNDSNQQSNTQSPELRAQLADKICELQDAEEKLKERERVHEQACRTIQKLMQKLSSQEKEINRYKQKQQQNNSLTEISSPVKQHHSLSDTETCNVDISRSLKQRYEKQIEDQDELIKQLQSEVKKKTANLQNLVNKELWEKNREVERLTKLVSGKQHSQQTVEHSGDDSTAGTDLQQSFTEADFVKAVKRNQLLQRKVDVLLQRLDGAQEDSKLVSQLKHELQSAQLNMENANKWRLECADVCSVLTNRLEELAGFLNSLLKHKDVLGVLAADRRHAMRRAVDRSLDLSKSLNMTLSITGVSLADQSLAQLSKLSEMLYNNEPDECNHTYNSHEDLQTAKASKAEARKERRSLPLPQQQPDNQSESEAWSEPDRKVSLARIGLEDTSNSVAGEKHHSESDSEGHACTTNTIKQERRSERIAQLEALIAQRDERLLQAQCQLVEADNRYKQEQLRVLELSQQLEQLRIQNDVLHADLRAIGCQEEQQLEELQALIEQKTQQLEQLQVEHKRLQADAQITELELQEAHQQILAVQKENQTKLAEYQLEISERLEAQQRLQQQELERNWVALAKYEELKSQLAQLQSSLEFYQDNEKELKQTLVENELSARALKKELDESTLQASKAIMERTKAYNDKLQLEQRLEEMRLQLVQLQEEQKHKQKQRQREPSDVSQSGYTSEELPQRQRAMGRLSNPSPDLGIESDTGRVQSVELSNAQHPLLKTVELVNDDILDEKDDLSPDTEPPAGELPVPVHDCLKVEQENAELRRKLIRTKRAFEDTYEKLRVVNKAKAQVEKDIKNQILKTHNVLRNVRSNMENVL
ncbi:centrosomin isoform X3 [Drosophila mojavensis]|uniref:centrosomin isoform X3 n=1 Tax=Drosophila mojavensis TaxID=7230 RepID=UPI0013EE93A9|nr:centrosomin isoform X3 [Drosophila mojavensis]